MSVLCVGDVMTDIVATLPGPLAAGSDTPAVVRTRPGGSAANTAAWLAAVGSPVGLVARVGDDPFGSAAAADLGQRGVKATLAVDPILPTGICVVLVGPDGERTMIPDAGANAALAATDLPQEQFPAGGRLHLSAYSLFSGARPAAQAALLLARRRRMAISVDAASAAPLTSCGPEAFFALIGGDLLLLANRDEAAVLTGYDDPHRSVVALAARVGSAIVKLGDRGAVWSDRRSLITATGPPVKALDTTGAGDAFAAALLHALDEGAGPAQALRVAHGVAAEACRVPGGRPPLDVGSSIIGRLV